MVMRGVRFNPVHQFRDEFDRLVTGAFNTPGVAAATRMVTGRSFPAINMWEDGESFFVEAEVPGLKSANLEITVIGDELTLKGERATEDRPELTYHRRERGAGSFSRSIKLPGEVNAERVEAALHDGVLTLTLPKTEAVKPRKIKVNAQ
ncbi:MAG: Hsp20/alpha crystallin family protein [Pirellulales bacterium]|nr:Hsp20/alpha crystallin family protein [Pirellulales bacterium]